MQFRKYGDIFVRQFGNQECFGESESESLLGSESQSDFECGATDYQKYQAVTEADVKCVANKCLTPERVVLSVVPTGKIDQASKPEESKKVTGDNPPHPEVKR